jgi:Xaa-Pro aminopeptidase
VYPHQAERLTGALHASGVNALIATSPANIHYVTGFRSLTHAVCQTPQFAVFGDQGIALVVPAVDVPTVVADGVAIDYLVCFGELPEAHAESRTALGRQVADIVADRAASAADALALALQRLGVNGGSVGLDDRGLDHEARRAVAERLGSIDIAGGSDRFAEARRIKAPYEIDCLAQALHVAEEALDVLIQAMDRGMTEREAFELYAAEVVKRGGWPLPSVVAMGEHTAIPAPWPSDRALRRGDLVRLEMRCRHKGYHAQVGRTAVLGEPTAAQELVYAAIRAGLDAAIERVAPGVKPEDVVKAAAEAVKANGLPHYQGHTIGHGVGLDVREAPLLGSGRQTTIEMGEVLAIELPYWEFDSTGVSAQDTALVTSADARVLNRSHRALVVLD